MRSQLGTLWSRSWPSMHLEDRGRHKSPMHNLHHQVLRLHRGNSHQLAPASLWQNTQSSRPHQRPKAPGTRSWRRNRQSLGRSLANTSCAAKAHHPLPGLNRCRGFLHRPRGYRNPRRKALGQAGRGRTRRRHRRSRHLHSARRRRIPNQERRE